MDLVAIQHQCLELYEAHADAIFRHCYYRVYDRELAKELVQETFMKTWEYLASGKKLDQGRAFLYRVAQNAMIDRFRKKKELSLDALQEQGFDPALHTQSQLERQIEGRDLARWLSTLDTIGDAYKEVILMRYIDDLSPKEIADVLGETENAVSVRLHRGMEKVRAALPQ